MGLWGYRGSIPRQLFLHVNIHDGRRYWDIAGSIFYPVLQEWHGPNNHSCPHGLVPERCHWNKYFDGRSQWDVPCF